MLFTKVKAVIITFALAALAGIGSAIGGVDWGSFGNFGPAIGLAVAAAVAYLVRETQGYGGTIPDQGDADSAPQG